jgi:hypothetical protein
MIYLNYLMRKLILSQPASQKRKYSMLFQLNKAPGPGRFSVKFHKQFLEVIKNDIIKLFAQLQHGDLPLINLNFGLSLCYQKRRCVSNSAV